MKVKETLDILESQDQVTVLEFYFIVHEREHYEAEHKSLIFDIARGCTTKEEYDDAKKSYVNFLNRDGLLVNKNTCIEYFQL